MRLKRSTGNSAKQFRTALGICLLLPAPVVVLLFSGCGTPGAPQPPSLQLPGKVSDLSAERAGDKVKVQWTTPRKTMDHLLIKGKVTALVCRMQESHPCEPAGTVAVEPGSVGQFEDSLPINLREGNLREGKAGTLTYFVELKNPHGRSAGLSNPSMVLAGAAPAPVSGLTAEVQKRGVVLHWTGVDQTPIRLHRKLLTPKTSKKKSSSTMSGSASEAILRDLLVDEPGEKDKVLAQAIDTSVRFGVVYEYTAQRVARVNVNGQVIELAGESSAPVRVEVMDQFPPAIPTGLVAVAVAGQKSIDLSWQAVTDDDLAGYVVYRRDEGEPGGEWKRISGPKPAIGPSYSDAAIVVAHSYRYAVSAVDATGRESKRSQEAQETAPSDQ